MSADTQTDANVERSADVLEWLVVVLGLWVLVTPFFLGPATNAPVWTTGSNWLFWSNVVVGIAIAVLGAIAAYTD
ncbi:MAG: hypothetical protein ABEJ28_03810 [Salinigranum sp.]